MSGLGQAMWRQAESDLAHARTSLAAGDYDWAVFAAQQSAEKGLKAVLLAAGREAPSIHPLERLFDRLVGHGLAQESDRAPLRLAMSVLTQGWAVSRYPLAGLDVAPTDLISSGQATTAIAHAETIIAFCRQLGIADE